MSKIQNHFIDKLDQEHRLIEELTASFVTYSQLLTVDNNHKDNVAILNQYAILFEQYIDMLHHGKEENILIPSFLAHGINKNSGPIQVILEEHKNNRFIIQELKDIGQKKQISMADRAVLQKHALDYCASIWEHIDKEDSVFFPEYNERVIGKALLLDTQTMISFQDKDQAKIQEMEQSAQQLINQFPPVKKIPQYFRGDGCANCSQYGIACQGIEIEWWSENEWEDFRARYS